MLQFVSFKLIHFKRWYLIVSTAYTYLAYLSEFYYRERFAVLLYIGYLLQTRSDKRSISSSVLAWSKAFNAIIKSTHKQRFQKLLPKVTKT